YDGYTVCPDNEYKMSVSDFEADGCHYLTENFVQSPVAGNTTFVSFCASFMPNALYTYDATTKRLSTEPNPTSGISFFAVAIVDEFYGFEDFALDPDNHHVLAFKTKEDADAYVSSLNVGEASAITVSETDAPLKAPASDTYDVNHRQFQTVSFYMGRAYYRINITTGGSNLSVVRNKFYKIEVKSITNLGFHSEDLLRPKDPTSDPGNSTSAWIEAVLTVAPWEEVKQDTNL
ncbi:MAG: Mfa1 fimbrilin C-terminal domain-containing protein, partial [Muribaculaceae bacterium]|nr:Mfa1 fimbrilin C-terminal domain-containing protein [Muribaculaceae bacterium]